jgi:hypothetical protein
MWFHFVTTGDAFAHSNSAGYFWGWSYHAPWEIFNAFRMPFEKNTIWVIITAGVFALSAYLIWLGRWAEGVWCTVSICMASLAGSVDGNLRYSIVLFPLYFGLVKLVGESSSRQSYFFAGWLTAGGVILAAFATGKHIV